MSLYSMTEFYSGFHAGPTVTTQGPHKHGYRPDLPLRSTDASVMHWARGVEAAYLKRIDAEPKQTRTIVSKTAAHPNSYRADLPLTGYTVAQLIRATKDDKAAWADRPLTYDATSAGPFFLDDFTGPTFGGRIPMPHHEE